MWWTPIHANSDGVRLTDWKKIRDFSSFDWLLPSIGSREKLPEKLYANFRSQIIALLALPGSQTLMHGCLSGYERHAHEELWEER